MDFRTYEYYEVRTNLGRDDEALQRRHSLREDAEKTFHTYARTADKNIGRVYLVRVQVIEVAKGAGSENHVPG